MRAVDLIRQKRDGAALDPADIRAFVAGVTDGTWPDYQITALLMAIVLKGMTTAEAAALTSAMVASGTRVDLAEYGPAVVDKHSTGGVGDKISLILAPLAASCGVIVPMMSGRGLGHTGGTLDKLEAIPGFDTRLPIDRMRRVLARVGCVLVGQTDDVAPADRRLYALRDVTATVESVPLISASILSKKIAEGARGLVLDVKVGRGAFMKTPGDARRLAQSLIDIAAANGLPTEAVLTAMDVPIGRAVGNAPEVIEAIETLKGRGPRDVEELSVRLTARMLVLGGIDAEERAATSRVERALSSGAALEKFRAIIEAQGGDARVIDDYRVLPQPTEHASWTSPAKGVVTDIDAEMIGRAAVMLGAGRDRADAAVDPSAGIELRCRVGDTVRAGDEVVHISARSASKVRAAHALVASAIVIGEAPVVARTPLILETLSPQSAAGTLAHDR